MKIKTIELSKEAMVELYWFLMGLDQPPVWQLKIDGQKIDQIQVEYEPVDMRKGLTPDNLKRLVIIAHYRNSSELFTIPARSYAPANRTLVLSKT